MNAPRQTIVTTAYMSGFGNGFETESRYPQRVTRYPADVPRCQANDIDCWADVKKHFNPDKP